MGIPTLSWRICTPCCASVRPCALTPMLMFPDADGSDAASAWTCSVVRFRESARARACDSGMPNAAAALMNASRVSLIFALTASRLPVWL